MGGVGLDARPDVVLILCDQLSPRFLGCCGAPWRTPNIDRIAAEGVLFREATCPWPVCSPSRASLITGLYPHGHGICHNVMRRDYPAVPSRRGEEGIRSEDVTTEKLLALSGYDTYHAGKWHLTDEDLWYYPEMFREHLEYGRQMSSYFARVRERPPEGWMDWFGWVLPVEVRPEVRAAARGRPLHAHLDKMGRLLMSPEDLYDVQVADHVIRRLGERRDRPLMVTCSFNAPHPPHAAPAPYYGMVRPEDVPLPPAHLSAPDPRFQGDAAHRVASILGEAGVREFLRIYVALILFVDEQVGRILAAVDRARRTEDTIVVFTADHGDMAGAHGMISKSTAAFYEDVVRVPLMIRYPARVRPGVSSVAASLVDVMPTLLELTGHPPQAQIHGRSLAGHVCGLTRDGPHYAFSERLPSTGRRRRFVPEQGDFMVRGEGWKYVRYRDGGESLHHLREDPDESRNRIADPGAEEALRRLRGTLAEWLLRTGGGP